MPAREIRVSGPFEILSKRFLLRYTGHSRQHALRVMMVMPVMEVQQTHLYFRVALQRSEVKLIPSEKRQVHAAVTDNLPLTRPAHSRTLPQ